MKWFRQLYDWVLKWADTPHAELALFLLALTESFIFPIPPDVLLIAMAVANGKRAFRYALICSVGSVIGGALGYLIGAMFMDSFGMVIINMYHANDLFELLKNRYQDNAVLAIAVSGFTPIPYKVFSVSSGAFDVSFITFIVTSAVSRSARFFLVATLLALFGAKIRDFIEKYFNLLTLAFAALLIGGFVVIKWVL